MITTSSHIETLLSMPSSFLSGILEFGLGDSETRTGRNISDAAITRLAECCPNLIHVQLDGTIHLTDTSLLALFKNRPHLRYVQFSGNDNSPGGLKGTALDTLREDPKMCKDLVKLRLTDQHEFEKKLQTALKALSTKRKKLSIEVGCTDGRIGSGVSTLLGGKEKNGYQALGGPGGFDRYGGYGGY